MKLNIYPEEAHIFEVSWTEGEEGEFELSATEYNDFQRCQRAYWDWQSRIAKIWREVARTRLDEITLKSYPFDLTTNLPPGTIVSDNLSKGTS